MQKKTFYSWSTENKRIKKTCSVVFERVIKRLKFYFILIITNLSFLIKQLPKVHNTLIYFFCERPFSYKYKRKIGLRYQCSEERKTLIYCTYSFYPWMMCVYVCLYICVGGCECVCVCETFFVCRTKERERER
jgi:hypothetical protein